MISPSPVALTMPARHAPETSSCKTVPGHVKLPLNVASRASRTAYVERWLHRLSVPDRVAAMVLDDAARRWALVGSCSAEHRLVSDIEPDAGAHRRCLRRLEAAGLITLTMLRTSDGEPIGDVITPTIGATVSPAAWCAAVLPLSRPAHPRAGR